MGGVRWQGQRLVGWSLTLAASETEADSEAEERRRCRGHTVYAPRSAGHFRESISVAVAVSVLVSTSPAPRVS